MGGMGGQPANQAQPVAGANPVGAGGSDNIMAQMLMSMFGGPQQASLGSIMQPIQPQQMQPMSTMPSGAPAPGMPNLMGAFQQGANALAAQAAAPMVRPPPRPTQPAPVVPAAGGGVKKAFIDMTPAERTQSMIDSGHAAPLNSPEAAKLVARNQQQTKQRRQGGSNR